MSAHTSIITLKLKQLEDEDFVLYRSLKREGKTNTRRRKEIVAQISVLREVLRNIRKFEKGVSCGGAN